MPTVTTDQGLTLPIAADADNVPLSMTAYNGPNSVESRLVKRYLSAADRTARNPAPAEGELSYRADSDVYEFWNGVTWVLLPGVGTPRGIMAVPASTGLNGTATVAAVETRDAVLGDYVFTATLGRRYRIMYNPGISGSVANDLFIVNIRDGGGATPTAVSPLVASTQAVVSLAGGPGQTRWFATATYTGINGPRTLGAFTVRSAGTGVATPIMLRELYVEDIGAI